MDLWLNEKRVTEIECLVPDLTGVARGKILPRGKFTQERGMRIPEAVLGMTEQLEPTPLTVGSAYDLKFELPQGLPEALQALRAEYKLRSGALHRRVRGDQGP